MIEPPPWRSISGITSFIVRYMCRFPHRLRFAECAQNWSCFGRHRHGIGLITTDGSVRVICVFASTGTGHPTLHRFHR